MIKAYKNRYIVIVTLLNLNCINVQEFFQSTLLYSVLKEKKMIPTFRIANFMVQVFCRLRL